MKSLRCFSSTRLALGVTPLLFALTACVVQPTDEPLVEATGTTEDPLWHPNLANKCLDADVGRGAISNGTKVQLWGCNGWDNQTWDYHF